MEVGAIEADRTPIERAIEGAIAPRSKGDRSRSKGDRTLQIYRAWASGCFLVGDGGCLFQVDFATGQAKRLWEMSDIVDVLEAWENAQKREATPIRAQNDVRGIEAGRHPRGCGCW